MSLTFTPEKFKVVLFTYHPSAVPLVNYLIGKKCLELIILPKGMPAKTLSPIIKILRPKKLQYLISRDQIEIVEHLKKINPDILLSFNYPYILKGNVLSLPHFAVNFHPGDLPKYRGANVLNWAIINGEKKIALTAHFMTEKIDAGNIIAKTPIKISSCDDAATLSQKIAKIAPKLAQRTFSLLEKPSFRGQKQIIARHKYYSRRKPEDGKIDLQKMKAREIINLVRALVDPWPGAYFYSGRRKIIIERAKIIKSIKLTPGEVKQKGKLFYLGSRDLTLEAIQR